MRLILIAAAFSLAVSPGHAQASLHWQMWDAIRKAAPHRCPPAGKPPAPIETPVRGER